jgi:hypothetical protein
MNYSIITLTVACILGFSAHLSAQSNPVPNPSFEQWTNVPFVGAFPQGWFFDFSNTNGPVFKSTDAHTGSFALGGKVVPAGDSTAAPFVESGNVDVVKQTFTQGFAVHTIPLNFEGYFKFHSVSNDILSITLSLSSKQIGGGYALLYDTVSSETYTHFSVPVTYAGPAPDTAIIIISVGNTKSLTHLGTTFVVDDLALTGGAGVQSGTGPIDFRLEQNYPNPFNRSTTIRYALPEEDRVTLDITNMLGSRVALIEDGRKSQGEHEVSFDAEHFSSGPYLCRLTTASHGVSSRIIQVAH